MKTLALISILCTASADPKAARSWHQLVGGLQYLEGDYRKALALKDPEEIAEQKLHISTARTLLVSLGEAGAPYLPQLESLRARIDAEQDVEGVTRECGALAHTILRQQLRDPAPAISPELKRGETVWQQSCAMCHGADGAANTPMAQAMTPRPARFDAEKLAELTPYKVFNTTMFGIAGTSMLAFPTLSDEERWAVAFFVFTLQPGACDHQPASLSLQELAGSSDAALKSRYGTEVACLRRRLPPNEPLAIARVSIEGARRLWAEGKRDVARASLVEAWQAHLFRLLDDTDAETRAKLEADYARAARGDHFETSTQSMLLRLETIQKPPTRRWAWLAVFCTCVAVAGFSKTRLRALNRKQPGHQRAGKVLNAVEKPETKRHDFVR